MIVFFIAFAVIVSAVISALKAGGGFTFSTAQEVSRRAVVVAKRMEVTGGENASTHYYATFEFEDGSREELCLNGRSYGILAEGDRGTLVSRGRAFVSFDRSETRYTAEDPANAVHLCPACGATYRGRVCDYCDTPWTPEKR